MIRCESCLCWMSNYSSDVVISSYFAGSSADHPTPFDDIAGVLRLSSKYDIPTFRQKSIQELKKLFPCTLPDLDSVYPLTPRPKAYILMISLLLARECNVLEL